MGLRRISYLIAGLMMLIVLMFCSIMVYNIAINKVPLYGLEKQREVVASYVEPNYHLNPSFLTEIVTIPSEDPIRNRVMTEDESWTYAWAFLSYERGLKLYGPFEKKTYGLSYLSIENKTPVPVWEFYVKQNFPSIFTNGGWLYVNAYSGEIVFFDYFM